MVYLPCWPRPKLPPGVYVIGHISFPLKIIVKNFKLSTFHIVTTCKYHWMSRYKCTCLQCNYICTIMPPSISLLFCHFTFLNHFPWNRTIFTNQYFICICRLRISHKTRIFIHCSLSSPVRTFYIISCYMEYYTNCHHFRNFTPETTLLPSKSWDC